MSRRKSIAIWTLQSLLVVPFVVTGATKLLSTPGWVTRFRAYGYPEHFYLLIGVIEVLCAIGLLIPSVAASSAACLIVVMMGAAVTHLLHSESPRIVLNLLLIFLLAIVVYVRAPQFAGRSQRDAAMS